MPKDEPARRLPHDHLHGLGERRHPEDPRPHGEPDADAFAVRTDDLDLVRIEHPVGLALPGEQDRPCLRGRTRQRGLDPDAHLSERSGEWLDRVDECVERGWLCSFAGNVTYNKSRDLQRAAKRIPDELLLVETDAPFLSPQPVRGKPNEPGNVTHTARFVADLRGVSYDELDALVERNSARVFGW